VKRYLKPLLGRVDRFLAVAESHRRYLVEREGLPADRVEVVYNGVDTARYRPRPPDPARARQLGLGGDKRWLVTVASLKPLKRIDLLIDAFARVVAERPELGLLIVGDGPERAALEARVRRLGLEDWVVFLGLREEVEKILNLSELFVLSSRTEAFPNALLEAMASGLPVVATNVGSVPELVEHGKSGLLVEPGDAEALARAILEVTADRSRARAMGEQGRSVVESRFGLDTMCRERERIFAEILCRRT